MKIYVFGNRILVSMHYGISRALNSMSTLTIVAYGGYFNVIKNRWDGSSFITPNAEEIIDYIVSNPNVSNRNISNIVYPSMGHSGYEMADTDVPLNIRPLSLEKLVHHIHKYERVFNTYQRRLNVEDLILTNYQWVR